MTSTDQGNHGERGSALWGTGNRGGESRSNALWGKGGRGALLAVTAALAMALPLAATAGRDTTKKQGTGSTYIAPSLLDYGKSHGGDKVNVIIQSAGGASGAEAAYKGLGLGNGLGALKKLDLIGGVAVSIPANKLDKLAQTDGLIVTPDANVKVSGGSGPSSDQLWPYESGNAQNWATDGRYSLPTIAILDSGIQDRPDFTGRILASVNLSTLPNNSPGDGRGHGTFVAGIAAGAAEHYAGAAPTAKLVSVDVMDDHGMGLTSDIIKGCQWVLDHKDQYNIKVVNMSLHSATPSHFYYDPLDKAVEKLWFSGITVVVAAGNYGIAGGPSGVKYAPGNDPLVITVGAADLGGTTRNNDDGVAPWSAWGYTYDGFAKPEVSAAGRFMIGPVPTTASLVADKPGNVTAPGYIQLSGTSFATPVVAGSAAQVIARHPDWTPDQVKGALMVTARALDTSIGRMGGAGEVLASKAGSYAKTPPNPNRAIERFYTSSGGSGMTFDVASWLDSVKSTASWDSASWDSASWLDASWDSASWLDASWDSASWLDASWVDASWLDASWLDASWEDNAEGEATGDPYDVASEIAALQSDPALAVPSDSLPVTVVTDTTSSATTAATTTTSTATTAASSTTSTTTTAATGTTSTATSTTTSTVAPTTSTVTTTTATLTSALP